MANSVLKNPYPQVMSGVAIPAGSNLNNYTTPGVYYVGSGSTASQISNIPYTGSGGRLEVIGLHSDTDYIRQFYYPIALDFYSRTYSQNSGWSEWFRVIKPFRHRANGTVSNLSLCAFAWVTTSSTQLSILAPTVTIDDSSFSSVTSLKIQLRKPTGGYLISDGYDIVSYLTSNSITAQGFYFSATKSDGWGVTNNLPLTGAIKVSATIA